MFGFEKNYQQLKTKHGEGSHITVGQGCRQEPGDIILITDTHVVVYWNGILTIKKYKNIFFSKLFSNTAPSPMFKTVLGMQQCQKLIINLATGFTHTLINSVVINCKYINSVDHVLLAFNIWHVSHAHTYYCSGNP